VIFSNPSKSKINLHDLLLPYYRMFKTKFFDNKVSTLRKARFFQIQVNRESTVQFIISITLMVRFIKTYKLIVQKMMVNNDVWQGG
jgi:hypothetical protein